MNKKIRLLLGVATGALASLALTSCYYDPNYGSSSVAASYNSGYGDGYGYGGSNFSTSVFVSTGNPQWGYDPNCYSYYDYNRRCYYDPYLNGYYPIGYRPPVVYGVPHPYGWHRGGGYIRPPVHVSNVTVNNYQNRSERYRSSNYSWAKQVRQQPMTQSRSANSYSGGQSNGYNRANNSTGKVQQSNSSRSTQGSHSTTRQSTTQGQKQSNSLPSRYNTPVRASDTQVKKSGGGSSQRNQAAQSQPSRQGQRTDTSRGSNNRDSGKGQKNSDKDNNDNSRTSRYR